MVMIHEKSEVLFASAASNMKTLAFFRRIFEKYGHTMIEDNGADEWEDETKNLSFRQILHVFYLKKLIFCKILLGTY